MFFYIVLQEGNLSCYLESKIAGGAFKPEIQKPLCKVGQLISQVVKLQVYLMVWGGFVSGFKVTYLLG